MSYTKYWDEVSGANHDYIKGFRAAVDMCRDIGNMDCYEIGDAFDHDGITYDDGYEVIDLLDAFDIAKMLQKYYELQEQIAKEAAKDEMKLMLRRALLNMVQDAIDDYEIKAKELGVVLENFEVSWSENDKDNLHVRIEERVE